MKRLVSGDWVRLRLLPSDEWTNGLVAMASGGDLSSVFLCLDGAVRTHDGYILKGIPLFIDYAAETVRSLYGDDYELEVAG